MSAAVPGVEGFPAAAIYNPAQLDNLKQSQQQHTSTNTDPCKNDTNTNTKSCIYDFAQLDKPEAESAATDKCKCMYD